MVSVRRLCNISPAPIKQQLEHAVNQLDVDLQGVLDNLSLEELIHQLEADCDLSLIAFQT